MMRSVFKWLMWLLGGAVVLIFVITLGPPKELQVLFTLAFGWVAFLFRVLPEVSFNASAVAQTLAVGAVLGGGAHVSLRWLWRQVRPEDASPWPARWTASLLALLVLLFCATMATVGVGHHVGWLAAYDGAWTSGWRFRTMERALSAGDEVCEEASRVLEADPSGASLSRELLERRRTRVAAESMHTVLVKGAGGQQELILFARDPLQREEDGVVRCWPASRRQEWQSARALSRLLAGEAVAEGAAF
jgi:hypothetical protein